MLEKCKLCKKEEKLQDSHVIPNFLYRYMLKCPEVTKNNLNGLLMLDSKKQKVDITQRQWKQKLFCKICEGILSKNETKFSRIFHDIQKMSVTERENAIYTTEYEKLKKSISSSNNEFNKFIQQLYFDNEKAETIKYFAASYLLRQLYLKKHSLGQREIDMLENYLLGKVDGDFNLIVKLNSGQPFKAFCSSLCLDQLEDFKHYNFVVPEMWFHLIFKLSSRELYIQPDDFLKNEDIKKLLSKPYQNASVTEKANTALKRISVSFPSPVAL